MVRWLPVLGSFGQYEVSVDGMVRGVNGGIVPRRVRRGRVVVAIEGRYRLLARIVANVFVSNPNGHRAIRYIDGNKMNVRASNLEWVPTKTESGPREPNKLSPADVAEIKRLLIRTRVSYRDIGWLFGVTHRTIAKIRAGLIHDNVPWPTSSVEPAWPRSQGLAEPNG